MAFQGVNFAAQRLVPSDDGRLYAAIFEDGALHGCALTYTGSTLTMAAGHLIAGGRQIEVDAAMSFPVTGAVSGFAQLVLVVDLTQTATTAVFNQVRAEVRYASSSEGFPTLQQQDINGSGSLYEAQLAIVSLGTGGITGIVQDLPQAKLKGGGAGLNFSVVGGTTQPENPKENTIWVNTDTAISEWVFSAAQPASPTAGMVWFQTGTSSSVAFNALKKNNITVYPTSCKQYISGAWTDRAAKTYQNSKWVGWELALYAKGVYGSDFTESGWTSFEIVDSSNNVDVNATVRYQENAYWRASLRIDFTPYSTVSVTHNDTPRQKYARPALQVVSSNGTVLASANLNSDGTEETVSLDISSINQVGYVQIGARYTESYSGSANFDFTMSELVVK